MTPPPEILAACSQNDEKAQSALYRLCHGHLMRIGMRYAAGDRQAALANVNEAFLRILMNLHTYKTHVPFEAWIGRIMINVVIDAFRKQKSYQKYIENQDAEILVKYSDTTHDNEAEMNLNAADIQKLLGTLPELTAKIFNLFAFDDFTHREIAEQLGISESASKWHVVKARNILKNHLQSYQYTSIGTNLHTKD